MFCPILLCYVNHILCLLLSPDTTFSSGSLPELKWAVMASTAEPTLFSIPQKRQTKMKSYDLSGLMFDKITLIMHITCKLVSVSFAHTSIFYYITIKEHFYKRPAFVCLHMHTQTHTHIHTWCISQSKARRIKSRSQFKANPYREAEAAEKFESVSLSVQIQA